MPADFVTVRTKVKTTTRTEVQVPNVMQNIGVFNHTNRHSEPDQVTKT
jgi:hypothetical protein